MKSIITILVAVYFSPIGVKAQEIDWSKTTNWKMYDVPRIHYNSPIDSLSQFDSVRLSLQTLQQFFSSVTKIPKEIRPYWEGVYICTAQTETGQRIEVYVSTFGGFFMNGNTMDCYEIPDERKEDWQKYFKDEWMSIKRASR
ncbi:hypothetical protein [Dinghuibacter silviterrae]|nr:hypothetical protein [Dinghuibacter silviterrae]